MSDTTVPTRRSRRRGFIGSAELAMVLPILFLVVLAGVEFSILFVTRGDVLAASRTGARVATQAGADEQAVRDRVLDVLGPRLARVADVRVQTAPFPGDVVTVAIGVPMQVAAPDLLWPIGLGLGDGQLYATTRMVRE